MTMWVAQTLAPSENSLAHEMDSLDVTERFLSLGETSPMTLISRKQLQKM